jgi:hypothetical protein
VSPPLAFSVRPATRKPIRPGLAGRASPAAPRLFRCPPNRREHRSGQPGGDARGVGANGRPSPWGSRAVVSPMRAIGASGRGAWPALRGRLAGIWQRGRADLVRFPRRGSARSSGAPGTGWWRRPGGWRPANDSCLRVLAVFCLGQGFGTAAGPSKPRMVDPSMGLGSGALSSLGMAVEQGRLAEVGEAACQGGVGGLGSGTRVPPASLLISLLSPWHAWDRSPQPSSPASVCAGSRPGAAARNPRFAVRERKRARHDGRSASGSNGTVKLQEQLPHHRRPQGCSHQLAQPGRTAPRRKSRASGPAIPRLL